MNLSDLNPEQRDAVTTLSGPMLVLAGAGTGKTRVITYRIAALIGSGIPAARILAVTFTNKAAREMQHRSTALLGKQLIEKPEISTFHSLCVKILRRQITHIGYPAAFAIYDQGDQQGVAREALNSIKIATTSLKPRDLLYFISSWKSQSVSPQRAAMIAKSDKEHLAAAAYRIYQQNLKLSGALDFDDILCCSEQLFREHPDVLTQEASRFDHLLIDEYQDTNGSQYRIVKALADRHRNLCVVGDDDQSIYGWRGADVTHILNFRKDWPDAKVVRLESNYRSRAPILTYANRLIAFNHLRHEKVLRPHRTGGEEPRMIRYKDELTEAESVVEEIRVLLHNPKIKPSDIAILFRTNEQPRLFESAFRRAKVPYTLVGSQSFFDRQEVREVMAYLKVIANPKDEISLRRIINTPPRGIGATTLSTLVDDTNERKQSLWEVVQNVQEKEGLQPRAVTAIQAFHAMIEQFRTRAMSGDLLKLVRDLIETIRYHDEIRRVYKEPLEQERRWKSVEEVINAVAEFQERSEKPTLRQLLEEVTLDRDDMRQKDSKNQLDTVTLMTLHSAKGLEFPHVYLIGLEEGILPHKRSLEDKEGNIDEERRLCYVGVTRAQEKLTITLADTRLKWGKPRKTIPSQFLFEMRGDAENARLLVQRRKAEAKAEQMRYSQGKQSSHKKYPPHKTKSANKRKKS